MTFDPFIDQIREARLNQNLIVTVFVKRYEDADEAERALLTYGIDACPDDDSFYLTLDARVVGQFRIYNGAILVDWLRSIDDLRRLDRIVDFVLKGSL